MVDGGDAGTAGGGGICPSCCAGGGGGDASGGSGSGFGHDGAFQAFMVRGGKERASGREGEGEGRRRGGKGRVIRPPPPDRPHLMRPPV